MEDFCADSAAEQHLRAEQLAFPDACFSHIVLTYFLHIKILTCGVLKVPVMWYTVLEVNWALVLVKCIFINHASASWIQFFFGL